jgi:hypothetical protein
MGRCHDWRYQAQIRAVFRGAGGLEVGAKIIDVIFYVEGGGRA